jgi:uncharacterized protein YcgI (DUF1989 family)
MNTQIPAASGTGLRLKRGELLKIIDPEGGQSGDLALFRPMENSVSRVAAPSTTAEKSTYRPATYCGPTAAARC